MASFVLQSDNPPPSYAEESLKRSVIPAKAGFHFDVVTKNESASWVLFFVTFVSSW